MRAIYLVSVWVHILAATVWVGGLFFVALVLVPWLKRGDRALAGAFFRDTGERFRGVGWTCFAILLVTGVFNLWVRGVRLADFVSLTWIASPFGVTVVLKLAAFSAVLVVSAFHDFVVGPRAAAAIECDAGSPEAEMLRRRAAQLGRLNGVLALALLGLGVMLVRGVPW